MQQLHCCSWAAVLCEWLWKGSAERTMQWFASNAYFSSACPFGFIFFINSSKVEWDDNKGEWLNYVFKSWVVSADREGRTKIKGAKKVEKWELKVAAWVVIKARTSLLEILSYVLGGEKGKSQNSWPGVGRGLKLACFGFKILYIAPWICFRTLCVYSFCSKKLAMVEKKEGRKQILLFS